MRPAATIPPLSRIWSPPGSMKVSIRPIYSSPMTNSREASHTTFVASYSVLLSGTGVRTSEYQSLSILYDADMFGEREGRYSGQNVRIYRVGKLLAAVCVRKLLSQQQ